MSQNDTSAAEFDEHLKLVVELLVFDKSRIEVLASEGFVGDAAREGFLMRTEVEVLGLGPDQVKLAASKLLNEHPELIEKAASIKSEHTSKC